eukprot:UN06712
MCMSDHFSMRKIQFVSSGLFIACQKVNACVCCACVGLEIIGFVSEAF